MSPKDPKGHGSSDKDPSLRQLAERIRKAPYPPTAPGAEADKMAKGLARTARKLLASKKGGKK